jgi:hypothetical protein
VLNKTLRENREMERTFERQCEEQRVEVIKESEIRQTQLQIKKARLETAVIEAQTAADARITSGRSELRDAKTKAEQEAIVIMNKARMASEESISRCERQVQKDLVNARADAASRVTDAKAKLQKAQTVSARKAINEVNNAMIRAEQVVRSAEQALQSAVAQAKGIRSVGDSKASAILAEMEAEQLGSKSMKAARLQEVELDRLNILNSMATKGNVMLTGARAAQVMDYLAPTGADKASSFASDMRTDMRTDTV